MACTAHQKVSRGCDQDSPKEYRLVISGEVHKRCPRRPILDDPGYYQELFWLYRQKERGYLVNSGGLHDQPALLVESFRIMDATLARVAAHRKDEENRKKKRVALKTGQGGRKSTRGRRKR